MNIRLSVLLLAALPTIATAQTALPPDIHPVTLSRLPPVTPEDLDEEGRSCSAARQNFTPGPGPTHVTVYSPRERSLGMPTGENSPIGARQFQLAVLIAAREIDQQYEWSAHEPAGRRQGLEQNVIDVVKYDRPVDRTRRQGRNDDHVRPHVAARAQSQQRALGQDGRSLRRARARSTSCRSWATTLRVGIMLNAVDQHLPPTREALLPPLDR